MDLHDARALVVGATGVLGGGVARELAARGALLTLAGRDQAALATLGVELGALATVTADLIDPAAPQRIIAAAGEQLDVLVMAAGVVAFGSLAELDDDTLDELLLVNLLAPIRLLRAALPVLAPGSVVVNVSAVVADAPMAGMAAYSASKAALSAFDRAVSRELRRAKVRVLDVRPPHTETGLADRPIAGTAPRLPTGKDPDAVAARIVRAIAEDEPDLPADAF